jgi:spore germination protein YaaH
MSRFFQVLIICTITAGTGPAQSRVNPGDYQHNASFLSRRFLTDSKNAAALTDDFLSRADKSYKTPILFPNGGLLSSRGMLDHAPYASRMFLDRVSAYESANRARFTVMPYLNAYSPDDHSHAANLRLDLNNAAVRANIVAECGRYVSARVPGSYVTGTARTFDGIVMDIEPAGGAAFFASLKILMADIRASFDRMGLRDKKIGVAAPQYTARTPKPDWGWDSSDYYYMAKYVNYVIAMTYDSGLTDESKYAPWMKDQTLHILQAVSGAAWRFDTGHPKPGNGVKVLIGLPGFYASTKAHNPEIENVAHGASGILDGLSQLLSTDRTSPGYFQGAVMFSHDGGADDSIYARYDVDWRWWLKHWLGR